MVGPSDRVSQALRQTLIFPTGQLSTKNASLMLALWGKQCKKSEKLFFRSIFDTDGRFILPSIPECETSQNLPLILQPLAR